LFVFVFVERGFQTRLAWRIGLDYGEISNLHIFSNL
jgi:hypothetical protein